MMALLKSLEGFVVARQTATPTISTLGTKFYDASGQQVFIKGMIA